MFKYKLLILIITVLLVTALVLPASTVGAAGAPSKIRFSTSPQAIPVNWVSGVMTLQVTDNSGSPANVSANIKINLASSSLNGRFDTDAKGLFNGSVTEVNIASGSNSTSFLYKDTVAGRPTITATSAGLANGIQQETIYNPVQTARTNGTARAQQMLNDTKNVTAGAVRATQTLNDMKAATARDVAAGMKFPGVTSKFAGLNPAKAAISPLTPKVSQLSPVRKSSQLNFENILAKLQENPWLEPVISTLSTFDLLEKISSLNLITNVQAAPIVLGIPHYYGPYANYANSPLPQLDAFNNILPGTGIRKFVDSLPGLGPGAANNLGQYIPVAVPDTTTYPGNDYYEIELREYSEKLHSDLPPTKLRGYVQVRNGVPVAPIHYLGPTIIAQRDRAVRVKFTNKLPTGVGGDLFLPTDITVMGAGTGPNGGTETYTQNRAGIHLHGNNTVWISDGTPHQWIAPAGETTSYPKGVSTYNVPDMPNPGPGSTTLYWTNTQSSRLMFYHDHAFGITRLNVLAGEAAPYLIQEKTEKSLISAGVIPATQIPLVIQDKTFVPDNGLPGGQLAATDPTWDVAKYGGLGSLWYPHVYMPNENPWDISGMNGFGRWPYGPWFYPPTREIIYPPIPNPYYDPINAPWEPPLMPATPNPSMPGEAFLDTPMVNGTAYPYLDVDPKTYRFRILNAANDRFLNLQLYKATSIISRINITNGGSGYTTSPAVTITPAVGDTTGRGAAAWAEIDPVSGAVIAITLDSVGSSYTATPIVTIAPPTTVGGVTATATATRYSNPTWSAIPTEVGMVPAARTPGFPAGWPVDGRAGGVPDPATAGPSFISIANEGGFLPQAAVLPMQPVNWNLDPTNFDMGVVNKGTLILGTAERADVIVDFSRYAGQTLILYNDAPAPFPALDARYDYYTSNPDNTPAGGAPSTQPGYGPNTRTIMQIRVRNIAPAAPYNVNALKAILPTAFSLSQDRIIVPQAAYNAAYRASYPVDPYVRIHDTAKTFTPVGSATPVTIPFQPKALHDEMSGVFDPEYGRLSSTLGLSIPNVAALAQGFVPFGFASPPVEIVKGSVYGTQIGSAGDGTQIWKISHNGVDTHTIHTHLFSVQVINRVAWDNAIRVPDPYELGWKETFRVNPLQDTIVALRPTLPTSLPFQVPNSIRPIDVTKPINAILAGGPGGFKDPQANPVTVLNHLVNLGWEYVYHCHLLAHEEMDMMHAVSYAVPPVAPSNLTASRVTGQLKVTLSWRDTSMSETAFHIQRASSADNVTWGTWATIATITSNTAVGTGTNVNHDDGTVVTRSYYRYRVAARNVVGDTFTYAAPSVGFPTMTVDSTYSNTSNTVYITP